VALLERWL